MNLRQKQETFDPLIKIGKIQSSHKDKLAIVYIRQSTLQQVEKHSESTKLQYALVDKAYQLGWPKSNVLVIDEDLGKSGSSSDGRPGFQRLVAEVGLDHVGIILGIEISRLARSCKDWHQLLEICAIFGTLIGDSDGIYDPSTYNDRLLLGLKGTMSEAELHVIKQRMMEGKRAKARRGELGMMVPMGYIQRPSKEITKDPDEQAQSTIQLVFSLFDKYATTNAILRYLVKNKIRMPYRERFGLQKGELSWHRPNRQTLRCILHNPIYTGAYVYGRRPTDPRKKIAGRPSTGRLVAKPDEWMVLIKDKLPSYISWKQYEHNLRQLEENTVKAKGAVKNGPSLLSGLIVCGICGQRMATTYSNNGSGLRYTCSRNMVEYGGKLCQSLTGKQLDELVEKQIFEALKPASIEISLQVAEDVKKERLLLIKNWEQRIERTNYEVARAQRQFNAVEPENRLVARSLEKQWEERLEEKTSLEKEFDRFKLEQALALSKDDLKIIRNLAQDIPALWNSPTTKNSERQAIARQLIDHLVVTINGKSEKVDVDIFWIGGCQTKSSLVRPVAKLEQLSYYPELLARTKKMHKEGMNFSVIAETLNKEGWKPTKRRELFNASMVSNLLFSRCRALDRKDYPQIKINKDEWLLGELAKELSMPVITLYAWLKKGELKGRRCTFRKIWIIKADRAEIARLKALKTKPRVWGLFKRVDKNENEEK